MPEKMQPDQLLLPKSMGSFIDTDLIPPRCPSIQTAGQDCLSQSSKCEKSIGDEPILSIFYTMILLVIPSICPVWIG
jgi:hypothetical protein